MMTSEMVCPFDITINQYIMPDITMCKDSKCPLKDYCYRFTNKREENNYFFNYSPYDSDIGDCEFYLDNAIYESTTD